MQCVVCVVGRGRGELKEERGLTEHGRSAQVRQIGVLLTLSEKGIILLALRELLGDTWNKN